MDTCSPCGHKDLSSDSQNPDKKPRMVTHFCNPGTEEMKTDRQIPRDALVSLPANLCTSHSVKYPVLVNKEIRETAIKSLISGLHIHICTGARMCTHTHTYYMEKKKKKQEWLETTQPWRHKRIKVPVK